MPSFKHHLTNNPNQPIQYYRAKNLETFKWYDNFGIGYLKSNEGDATYDKSYWDNYMKLRDTDIGKALTQARVDLAAKYCEDPSTCVDIGIGNGQFVDAFECFGNDVNPYAIDWLKTHYRFAQVGDGMSWDWITMWDVIEHIEPDIMADILENVTSGVVLSTPIYDSFTQCISSKHFKPNEHILYFTNHGIITYMEWFGFRCVEMSTIESKLGREKIGSFVFVR